MRPTWISCFEAVTWADTTHHALDCARGLLGTRAEADTVLRVSRNPIKFLDRLAVLFHVVEAISQVCMSVEIVDTGFNVFLELRGCRCPFFLAVKFHGGIKTFWFGSIFYCRRFRRLADLFRR